ncbi:hypothetical protein [Streptomyces tailanensis]|uniref:hypothetical protein n=1 Tax=Streptomyces tailanensis TaxID=2569858 RepID=UPI001FEB7555|nr:hypothetical protein [Streptomyces tailanensis]
MVDGTLERFGCGTHGLSVVDWRSWPAEQAAAVESFVNAWWEGVLTMPESPYPIQDVFETCAAILGSMTPLLDRWRSGPVADVHLLSCVERWLDDLLSDQSPFCWYDDATDSDIRALQTWLAEEGLARLEARDYGLALRVGLLAVPVPERWDRMY